jgi:hypothetical protein
MARAVLYSTFQVRIFLACIIINHSCLFQNSLVIKKLFQQFYKHENMELHS